MPTLREEELSSLYPKPKSYRTLRNERRQREYARRPKWVSTKVAIWSTCIILATVTAYKIISSLLLDNLSSTDNVLSGVSFSILTGIITLFLLIYLVSLISGLTSRILTSTTGLHTILLLVTGASYAFVYFLMQSQFATSAVALAAALHFCSTLVITNLTIRLQESTS